MSWLYSQVLVEEFLGDSSLDGEQSVPLSGNHTQQAYCAPDKMMDFSRLSRFGMTYKPLTATRGEELLMSYLAAFHVPTSAQQERGQELTEKPLECGEKWRGSFVKYDPDSSLWRTHQCSLLGDLDEFLETWPQWGLMRDGECWEQQTLERHIRGTGYGLSPNNIDSFHTPNTTGLDGGSNSRRALKKRIQMWRTPDTGVGGTSGLLKEGKTHRENGQPIQIRLVDQVNNPHLWPTPCSTDYKGSSKTGQLRDRLDYAVERGATKSKTYGEQQITGQLNPPFPEWLMGWPLGWTDLKPLEMGKSHCVQQPHGES